MLSFRDHLLTVAAEYDRCAAKSRGRSLARIATVVVNRGSFFDSLEKGADCSLRNFERFVHFFSDAENWPSGHIPVEALSALEQVGGTKLSHERVRHGA